MRASSPTLKALIAFHLLLTTQASSNGNNPWEKYVLSPSSRNPGPKAVHAVLGNASTQQANDDSFVLHLSEGSLVSMDFGVEVGGRISFKVESESETPLSLAFAESPTFVRNISDDTGATPFEDWDQALTVTVSPGTTYYQMPKVSFRGGFRFVTFNGMADVTISNITCEIGFATNMPNLRGGPGYFYTSDAEADILNRVWYAGAYTVQTNIAPNDTGRHLPQVRPGWAYNATLGVLSPSLVDGAKRDRAIWPGDMGISGVTAMLAHGAAGREAVCNSLETLFYYQNASTGLLPFAGPDTASFQNGAKSDTYHAWGLIAIADYATHSGDEAWLSEHWVNITRAVQYILDRLDPTTGLQNQTETNDWGRVGMGGFNSALNALDYQAIVSLAALSKNTSQASSWTAAAGKLKSSYNNALWDSGAGLYRDNTTTTLHPQDGNSLALLYNLTLNDTQAAAISAGLERNWNSIGPITPELPNTISPFVSGLELLAHFRVGEVNRGFTLLRRLWGFLIDGPEFTGSTLVEGITANGSLYYRSTDGYAYDASYTSLSHGWSTAPTQALVADVLGFKVLGLGGRTWEVRPALGNLTSVKGGFETGLGWFEARVEVREGFMTIELETPLETNGLLVLPAKYSKATVDNVVSRNMSVKGGKRNIVCS